MISKPGHKRFNDPPKSLGYKSALKKINKIIRDAPNHEIESIYNSASVRRKMREYFGDKCIFCETIPIASSSFRIDHYRPKKFIKGTGKAEHYGYYWLALEWTNLVQSCELCNAAKSNSFPVNSKRVNALLKEPHVVHENFRRITNRLLVDENPLLLHPEIDQVEDHLVFLPSGKVIQRNDSMMGKESINVYALNRGDLVLMRKKKIDHFFNELIYVLSKFEDRGADIYAKEILKNDANEFFRRLLMEQDDMKDYSRLGFYMFHDFEKFFIDRIPVILMEHKEFLMSFYNNLLASVK